MFLMRIRDSGSNPLQRRTKGAQNGSTGAGLSEVGVRSNLECQFLIVLRAVNGREADKRDLVPASILTNLSTEPVAVQVRHQQIGNNGIHWTTLQNRHCFITVCRRDYRITVAFQDLAQEFEADLVIVGD